MISSKIFREYRRNTLACEQQMVDLIAAEMDRLKARITELEEILKKRQDNPD